MTNSEGGARRTILVAEDDRVMSDVIRFNLERAGYATLVARSGSEAWQLLQTQHVDLLVTDYQMPGLSGEEVCRAVRDQLGNAALPVILLSARGMELDVDRLKEELNIEFVLFKPFSPRHLVEAVAASLKAVATVA